jgi:hypothetical protein
MYQKLLTALKDIGKKYNKDHTSLKIFKYMMVVLKQSSLSILAELFSENFAELLDYILKTEL